MSSERDLRRKPAFFFPQRYIMSALMGLTVTIVYDQHMASNIALKYMVLPKNDTEVANKTTLCDVSNNAPKLKLISDDHYNWDENVTNSLNNALLFGYYSFMIPGGILSDRYGGKLVLEICLITSSVISLVVPGVLHQTGGNRHVIVVLKWIHGIVCGSVMPAIYAMLGHWSPPNERCRLASFTLASTQISWWLNTVCVNLLIETTNSWASVFYLFGSVGVVLCLIWHYIGASRPSQSRCIDEEELKLISDATEGHVFNKKDIPLCGIIRSPPVWVLIGVEVSHVSLWLGLIFELPIYFDELLGHDDALNRIYLTLAFCLMFLTCIACCWFTDYIIEWGHIHITTTRKIFTTFGLLGPIIFLVTQSYLGCKVVMSIAMLCCAVCLMSFSYSGIQVNVLDLAPNYGGTLKGIVKVFGIVSNIYVFALIRTFAPNHTLMELRRVYWYMVYSISICNFAFMVFASAEEQAWNFPTDEE